MVLVRVHGSNGALLMDSNDLSTRKQEKLVLHPKQRQKASFFNQQKVRGFRKCPQKAHAFINRFPSSLRLWIRAVSGTISSQCDVPGSKAGQKLLISKIRSPVGYLGGRL